MSQRFPVRERLTVQTDKVLIRAGQCGGQSFQADYPRLGGDPGRRQYFPYARDE